METRCVFREILTEFFFILYMNFTLWRVNVGYGASCKLFRAREMCLHLAGQTQSDVPLKTLVLSVCSLRTADTLMHAALCVMK